MMSGHGHDPIFFNKKIKIGRPEHSLNPQPLRPITSHFCLTPPPPPLKVNVIRASTLMTMMMSLSSWSVLPLYSCSIKGTVAIWQQDIDCF